MIRIRNKAGTKEVLFDNKAYTLNEKDLGTADTTHSTVKGLGQVGEFLTNTSIGSRKINLVGFILAENAIEMEVRKRDLFKLVNPLEEFDLIVGNYKLSCVSNDTMKFSVNHYENNNSICKFQLAATALSPCFEPLETTIDKFAYWEGKFKFPFTMTAATPFIVGLRQPDLIVKAQNNGDIEIGMIIKFKAVAALSNPYLTNITTGKTLTITKDLVAGEEIEINTNYGKKSILGTLNGETTNYFSYLNLSSSFLTLAAGENLLRYGASVDSNLEVSIEYVPKFLGV